MSCLVFHNGRCSPRSNTLHFGCTVLQVIGFVHTVLKEMDLGLKTVLVVVPVNVLHNWRSEFHKWQPGNEVPIPVYMLEDVARFVFALFYYLIQICITLLIKKRC